MGKLLERCKQPPLCEEKWLFLMDHMRKDAHKCNERLTQIMGGTYTADRNTFLGTSQRLRNEKRVQFCKELIAGGAPLNEIAVRLKLTQPNLKKFMKENKIEFP